jgi:hypothetical protein
MPNISSVDHPSIAHLPRSALGFFVFRHFGLQVAFESTRRSFPSLPRYLIRRGCSPRATASAQTEKYSSPWAPGDSCLPSLQPLVVDGCGTAIRLRRSWNSHCSHHFANSLFSLLIAIIKVPLSARFCSCFGIKAQNVKLKQTIEKVGNSQKC